MRIKTGSKRFWEVLEAKELGPNAGESRPTTRQIVLLSDDSEKLFTFIHELIHVASHDEGLGLTEKQVLGMEKWLKKVFKHNDFKKLFEFCNSLNRES